MQQPGQVHRADGLRELDANRRGQVLDVGHAHDHRLGGRSHPHRVRLQRALDPPGHDRLLLAVLGAAQKLLAQVIVDCRIGAAPRRARQRHRAGALALATHEELGAGGEEGGGSVADGEHRALREGLAQDSEDRSGVVGGRRVDLDLAGEHDLLHLPRADALDRARHRGDVVLRRHRPRDPRALGRRGVEQRQRHRAQIGESVLETGEQRLGDIVGRRRGGERQPGLPSPPCQRDLGNHQGGRGEPGPVRSGAAVGREGEPAHGHEPGAARPVRRVDHRARDEIAPGGRDRREAVRAPRLERAGRAQGGEREAVAVGLLPRAR